VPEKFHTLPPSRLRPLSGYPPPRLLTNGGTRTLYYYSGGRPGQTPSPDRPHAFYDKWRPKNDIIESPTPGEALSIISHHAHARNEAAVGRTFAYDSTDALDRWKC
jgi:hypothetical protein